AVLLAIMATGAAGPVTDWNGPRYLKPGIPSPTVAAPATDEPTTHPEPSARPSASPARPKSHAPTPSTTTAPEVPHMPAQRPTPRPPPTPPAPQPSRPPTPPPTPTPAPDPARPAPAPAEPTEPGGRVNAIDRYRVATEAWRRADRARRKAALERAYAIADMVATAPPGSDPVRAVARHVRL